MRQTGFHIAPGTENQVKASFENLLYFFKWAIPGLFFLYSWSFSNKKDNFYNNFGSVKNVLSVSVLGFEPKTS